MRSRGCFFSLIFFMFSNTVFLIKSKGSFLEKYIEFLTEFKMVMKETKSLGFQTPCEEVLGPPQSIFFKWFLFNLLLGFDWVTFLSAYDITWKVDGAIPMYWFIMAPLLSHLLGVAIAIYFHYGVILEKTVQNTVFGWKFHQRLGWGMDKIPDVISLPGTWNNHLLMGVSIGWSLHGKWLFNQTSINNW